MFKTAGILALLGFASRAFSATNAATQPNGQTTILAGISYFVPASPVSSLDIHALTTVKKSSGELVPLSVIPTSEVVFNAATLQAVVKDWSVKDDVWSEAFLAGMPFDCVVHMCSLIALQGIYVTYNGTRQSPSISLGPIQGQLGVNFVLSSDKYPRGVSLTQSLPSGPYFLDTSTGNIFEGRVAE